MKLVVSKLFGFVISLHLGCTGLRYIAATTEAWELSSLAHKVNNIHSHLLKQITLCHQHIGESYWS